MLFVFALSVVVLVVLTLAATSRPHQNYLSVADMRGLWIKMPERLGPMGVSIPILQHPGSSAARKPGNGPMGPKGQSVPETCPVCGEPPVPAYRREEVDRGAFLTCPNCRSIVAVIPQENPSGSRHAIQTSLFPEARSESSVKDRTPLVESGYVVDLFEEFIDRP